MATVRTYIFSFRIEEYPTIGQFVFTAFTEDKNDFQEYTDFADPFEANFKAALANAGKIIYSETITSQLSFVTQRLYQNTYAIRPIIDKIANFADNAKLALNISVADFGISQVRAAINNLDTEALNKALNLLNQNIDNNLAALAAKGFKTNLQIDLQKYNATIFDDNIMQKTLIDKRKTLITANAQLLNDTYENFIGKVTKQAKNIYRNTNKTRLQAYTISKLTSSIRRESLKTLVKGLIVDADGKPVKNAKIIFKPIDGSRTKTVKTDAQGRYSAPGIKPNDYTVIISTPTLSKIESLTLNSAEHKTLDSTLS